MITAYFIEHDHIEWSCCRSLFVKTAHMETNRVQATVNKLVYGSLIAVKGKHDGLIFCEVLYEGGIIQPMRVYIWRVKCHQINNVHHAHLQFWNVMAKPPRRRNSFHSHDITGTTQHHIRLKVTFIACPVPYGQTTGAVFNGLLHVQELKVRLLVDDNWFHRLQSADTMVIDKKSPVCIL